MKKLISYIIKLNNQRKALNQLQAMSDRELRDIGLLRSDITRAVYGTPERSPDLPVRMLGLPD